jgi:hypothetical protein
MKPQTPEWHAFLAEFWSAEVERRTAHVAEVSKELTAARKALRQHRAKASSRGPKRPTSMNGDPIERLTAALRCGGRI